MKAFYRVKFSVRTYGFIGIIQLHFGVVSSFLRAIAYKL